MVAAAVLFCCTMLDAVAQARPERESRVAMAVSTTGDHSASLESLRRAAVESLRKGAATEAVEIARKILATGNSGGEDLKLAGELFSCAGHFSQAAMAFVNAAEKRKDDSEIRVRAVECLLAAGKYDGARLYALDAVRKVRDVGDGAKLSNLLKIASKGPPRRISSQSQDRNREDSR